MKKSLLFLFVFAMATTLFAQQDGTLTSDPEVIDPTGNATLYYDGTGTNFVISLVNDGSKRRTEIQELI